MGAGQPGPLAERIGNVELNPLRSALLCRPYVGPNASLVARPPPADLLICAKDLFFGAIAAMIGGRARGVPRLRLRAAQQALRTLRAMCDPIERVPPHGAWLWRLRDDVAARWR